MSEKEMRKFFEYIKKEVLELWKLVPLVLAAIVGWEIGKFLLQ